MPLRHEPRGVEQARELANSRDAFPVHVARVERRLLDRPLVERVDRRLREREHQPVELGRSVVQRHPKPGQRVAVVGGKGA